MVAVVVRERKRYHIDQWNDCKYHYPDSRQEQQRFVKAAVQQRLYLIFEFREPAAAFRGVLGSLGAADIYRPQREKREHRRTGKYSVQQYQHRVIAVFYQHVDAKLLVEVPAALHRTQRRKLFDVLPAEIHDERDKADLGSKEYKPLCYLTAEEISCAHDDVGQLCEKTAPCKGNAQPPQPSEKRPEALCDSARQCAEERACPRKEAAHSLRYLMPQLFVPRQKKVVYPVHLRCLFL